MLDCLKCLKKIDFKKTGIFAAGVLFGTAGVKILASKDARKLYTNCTAAALRAKSTVLKIFTQKLSRLMKTELQILSLMMISKM